MNIEHIVEHVRVVRYRTIAEALSHLGAGNVRWPESEEGKGICQIVSNALLSRSYEGDVVYRRDCGLVSIKDAIGQADFIRALARESYYPASLSEVVSYLSILIAQRVSVDQVLHLGMRILDDSYQEYRLLSRLRVHEFTLFFPTTKLKPGYHIVVTREDTTSKRKR